MPPLRVRLTLLPHFPYSDMCARAKRTLPHTDDDFKTYDQEERKPLDTGNFITHPMQRCKAIPPSQSWDTFSAAIDREMQGLPPLPADQAFSSEPSQLERTQNVLQMFVEKGKQAAASGRVKVVKVTQSSYREHVVHAILLDDLTYSHCEHKGTLRLHTHLLPSSVEAHIAHQTIRRDITLLDALLDRKLTNLLKVKGLFCFLFRLLTPYRLMSPCSASRVTLRPQRTWCMLLLVSKCFLSRPIGSFKSMSLTSILWTVTTQASQLD